MVERLVRFGCGLVMVSLAAAFGCFIAAGVYHDSVPVPWVARYYPFPHHIPPRPGGVGFRFAMAHDVVHERFPKHGPAYYRERDRLTREKLAALAPDDPAGFPLADDLGAGLERLGRSDEAVGVIRAKLKRQQARGLTGRDLYTSYANLGTFLIHANFRATVAGDRAARERFREGLGFVKQSVEVNPDAHFGREKWQAVIGEFILAATDDPGLLRQFDFIGDELGVTVDPSRGRPTPRGYSTAVEDKVALRDPEAVTDPDVRENLRSLITVVGSCVDQKEGDRGWKPSRVAFDEPLLGVIGMWRQGGGANPHFALTIGETMLRVGQRYIAWAAFERAYQLADRFWPDPALQQFLRDHCRKRQAEIEKTLPAAETTELRPKFVAELAYGEGYQRAYQEYEERKIAAGVPIGDEHFFDDFNHDRPPIASPSGSEEWYATTEREHVSTSSAWLQSQIGWGLFGAGLGGLVAAGRVRWIIHEKIVSIKP